MDKVLFEISRFFVEERLAADNITKLPKALYVAALQYNKHFKDGGASLTPWVREFITAANPPSRGRTDEAV